MGMLHKIMGYRSAIILSAVSATIILAGCGAGAEPTPGSGVSPENPQSVAAEATVKEDGAERDALPEVSLPSDFPASVPLYPGRITRVTEIDMRTGKTWNLHVRVDDSTAAMEAVREDLTAGGFAEMMYMETGAMISGTFTNADHRVAVQNAKDINGLMLLYTVSPMME